MRNRPVVIQGALDECSFSPLRDFKDLGYLRRRCGHRTVTLSGDLCKDSAGRAIFLKDPVVEMTFDEYIDLVQAAEDGQSPSFYMCKMPLGQELPELAQDIDASL